MQADEALKARSKTEAWFVLPPGGTNDWINLLYWPYMSMNLSYVVLGASIAPRLDLFILAWTVAAFFLGLISAHTLDELRGRGLGTQLSDRTLKAIAFIALSLAIAIGLYGIRFVGPWLIVFLSVEAFFVLAYNMEWFKGAFHSDVSFAFSWGFMPLLTSYYANAREIGAIALLFALVAGLTSSMQATMSRWLKFWRRTGANFVYYSKNGVEPESQFLESISLHDMLQRPQRSMKILVLTTNLLMAAFVLIRFL